MKTNSDGGSVFRGFLKPLLCGSCIGAFASIGLLFLLALIATWIDVPPIAILPLAVIPLAFGSFFGGFACAKLTAKKRMAYGNIIRTVVICCFMDIRDRYKRRAARFFSGDQMFDHDRMRHGWRYVSAQPSQRKTQVIKSFIGQDGYSVLSCFIAFIIYTLSSYCIMIIGDGSEDVRA